ncbi:MAG: hypothetical protein JW875_06020 [Spirochaetales bacterium]|nr:hypothetical protein [Spirochaetales bacterium]
MSSTLTHNNDTVYPFVRKASGELERFIPNKLADSLRSAGADEMLVEEILHDIISSLSDGIPTRKIYAKALSQLGRRQKTASARYRVKNALMQLGPDGHPFEVFMGELFASQGLTVEVSVILEGASVNHEMDVVATGAGVQHLVECKYSQSAVNHVSIQVPLYVHSRVRDIIALREGKSEYDGITFIPWIATNTRFSSDSLQYANHYNLSLISWDYPRGEALKDLIVSRKLYPVTILSTLGEHEKTNLVQSGIVTCASLAKQRHVVDGLDLSHRKRDALEQELSAILN